MAKSTTRAKRARDAVGSAADNQYLRRLMEDEDLRDSVRDAIDAARDAYDRLSSNGSVIDTAIDDKKLHKDLKATAENLRDATSRLRGEEKKRHWDHEPTLPERVGSTVHGKPHRPLAHRGLIRKICCLAAT